MRRFAEDMEGEERNIVQRKSTRDYQYIIMTVNYVSWSILTPNRIMSIARAVVSSRKQHSPAITAAPLVAISQKWR
jgi:hypothetical protein